MATGSTSVIKRHALGTETDGSGDDVCIIDANDFDVGFAIVLFHNVRLFLVGTHAGYVIQSAILLNKDLAVHESLGRH